jgi:exosome complex component RRP46
LVDAGIPLSGLLAAVSCGVTHEGEVFLDPSKQEEQRSKAHVCLVFPSRPLSAVPELPLDVDGEPVQHGVVTCVTRGAMEVQEYIKCVELGRAASAKISEFSRTSIERCQVRPMFAPWYSSVQ